MDEYGELGVQRHAMYCLWMMDRGKVHVPPAWLTASLKGDWRAPRVAVPEVRHSHAKRLAADGVAVSSG